MQTCVSVEPGVCPNYVNEDCLYLTVTAPLTAPPSDSNGYPVLIWIHGGEFLQGRGDSKLQSAESFAKNGIITVTFNYRLGAFGFLGSQNLSLAGNYGFLDQRMAIQWVSNNIGAFGGDPGRITLAGDEAGAMSVAAHISSPASRNLFNAAIIQSNPFGVALQTMDKASVIGDSIVSIAGCDTTENMAVRLSCMKGLDANIILSATATTAASVNYPIISPIADVSGEITDQPFYIMSNGFYQPLPILAGTTANDGFDLAHLMYPSDLTGSAAQTAFNNALSRYVGPSRVASIKALYSSGSNFERLGDTLTDGAFYCPLRQIAKGYPAGQSNSNIYLYRFDVVPSFLTQPSYCNASVCTGADLPFVFNTLGDASLYSVNPQPSEYQVAAGLNQAWSQFVIQNNLDQQMFQFASYQVNEQLQIITTDTNVADMANFKSVCNTWDSMNVYPKTIIVPGTIVVATSSGVATGILLTSSRIWKVLSLLLFSHIMLF